MSIFQLYIKSFSGLNRYVWLLALVNLINRTGSMVLPFMTLYLTKELGIPLSNAGYAMSAYGLGSIIGSYLGGKLADKYHYKDIQVASLLFGGIMLLPLIFIRSFPLIVVNVFLFSIVAESFRPANTVSIAAFSKTENRTRSLSLMRLAFNLGFTLGPAIGGIVAGLLGYKWLFLIDSLTCIAAAFVLIYALPKKERTQEESKNTLDEREKSPSVYKDKKFLLFALLVAFYAISFFQLFNTVPVFFARDLGYSEPLIGLLLALNGAFVVLLEMPIVAKLESYSRFMILIMSGCLSMALAYLLLVPAYPSIVISVIYTFFITVSEILAMPFMMNFTVSRAPVSRQGEYVAVYSIAYGIAHILAPLFGFWIADHYGFSTMFSVFIGISILLAFVFYSLRKKHDMESSST